MPLVNGKRAVVDLGLQPICGSAIPYKLRWHLLLDVDHPGRYKVLKAYEHERHVFPPDQLIDAGTGSRLLAMIAPVDQGPAISADQALDIETMISDVGADRAKFLAYMGFSSVAEIPQANLQKAIEALGKKKTEKEKLNG